MAAKEMPKGKALLISPSTPASAFGTTIAPPEPQQRIAGVTVTASQKIIQPCDFKILQRFRASKHPNPPTLISYPKTGDTLMATDKQIAANRLNAQKSTGPKTPEGRVAVRLNGVKHGLYAETLVLPGESESDFTALLGSYEAEHQPATPTEEALVQQLTMAMWRLRRLYHAEAAFLARERKFLAEWNSKTKLDDRTLTGMAVNANRDTVSTFRRQEAALERTFYRAMHELEHIRARRPAALALVPPIRKPTSPTPEISNIPPNPDPAIPAPPEPIASNPSPPDPPAPDAENL
jgi:hypothetical protein